nr:type II toxin-antitoxin system RelE/ParE family toxin [Methylorubrum thiocyanatum]
MDARGHRNADLSERCIVGRCHRRGASRDRTCHRINPAAGDVIPGTGGLRKVRIAGKGRGKSGGYRIISYYAAADVPVFLLALVSKGQRADISQAERNVLRAVVGTLAEAYRQGVASRIRAGGSSSRE